MAESRADGRLSLTVIGGFLGAGKSSWLRHHLHEGHFARHHILVNEAAGTPVDNLLLQGAARLTVLAGGCACCDGLPALLTALRQICDGASGAEAGEIDGIVLETSGLADPGAIALAIAADPVLARRLVLSETLVLCDGLHGAAQLSEDPLARAQIEAADRLVLTRPLVAPKETMARLIATLRRLNPLAGISGAELGSPVPLPEPGQPLDLPDPQDLAPIRPFRLDISAEGAWVALSTWLSALLHARGEDVIRVKGVIRTPAGRLLLQSVRRVVQPPEILPHAHAGPAPDEDFLVLIGRNFDAALLEQSWRRFGA